MSVLLKRMNVVKFAGVVLSLAATGAMAHPGHIGHLHESLFTAGLMHPLTGLDHLLAMLAVGLWSALTHRSVRQAALAPVVFLIMLFVGAMLGILGLRVPMVELMIMVSLLILGLLVAGRTVIHRVIGFAVVGVFAMFHGLAHGMELPAGDGAMVFVAGFMFTTLMLHLVGLFGGFQLKRYSAWFSRVLGGGIAAYGALLFMGV